MSFSLIEHMDLISELFDWCWKESKDAHVSWLIKTSYRSKKHKKKIFKLLAYHGKSTSKQAKWSETY